jgi:hypothetical protein
MMARPMLRTKRASPFRPPRTINSTRVRRHISGKVAQVSPMMHNNNGRMMEERKDIERGMDFRTDSDAPMELDGGNHHPPGRSARNDTNAADDVQRLFSPRSTAAMALSSISQTFSMGSETAYESKSNDSSNGSDPSQENDERLPFLPSVATTKMSAPPPQSHAYRCVTEPSPSTVRNHFYPHHHPPPYSSSPAMHYAASSELYHKNDKHHAPPYSTPDVNMQLERSFSASSDPMTRARSHVKPPANYQSYHQPQFTPSLPPKSDGSRRAPSHYPPNDPYHPRMVSWNNADPATMQWMPYPHHHQVCVIGRHTLSVFVLPSSHLTFFLPCIFYSNCTASPVAYALSLLLDAATD